MEVIKFVTHSKTVQDIALQLGWYVGAKYTNIRNIKTTPIELVKFIDIDWNNYNYAKHLEVVKNVRPWFTVAKDFTHADELPCLLEQAEELSCYADNVIVVPKVYDLRHEMEDIIPAKFTFGYSVPTKYGGTLIEPNFFRRQVHLLGGRPDIQRQIANNLNVVSLDCNRFTLDASFGDYFNGQRFVPHPTGGYKTCVNESVQNINTLWVNYKS